MASLHDERGLREIAVGAVGAGAHEDLLHDRMLLECAHRHDIIRLMWEGDQWLEAAQVEIHLLIVLGIRIRKELGILVTTLLCLHKGLDDFVGREDRGGGTHLGTHVRDGETLRYGQGLHALADILKHLPKTALDGNTAKHLEDDFLCIHASLQLSCEIYLHDLRHRETHRHTGHRRRDIHTADADGQHADSTARWGMAVATHQKLTRGCKTGGLHHMTDTVSRSRYIHTGLLCDGPKIIMIVRCLEIDVQQIVIEMGYRGLHLCRDAQLLEAEIGHNRIDIVGQGLINLHKYILARYHRPLYHVGTDNLSR